jgi:hypothetical protein
LNVTYLLDSTIPQITILSPANTTYNQTTIYFNVSLNEGELTPSTLYPKDIILQFEKVWLPKSLGIEGGTGKESYIALYTKDQVQANLDKIPDEVYHTIMNFGAPIFLKDPSKNKPQPFSMPDSAAAIRGATATPDNPRGTLD